MNNKLLEKLSNKIKVSYTSFWIAVLFSLVFSLFVFQNVFADTLSYSDIGWIDYNLGGVHTLKVMASDDYELSYESDDYFDGIKNVASSNISVASANIKDEYFVILKTYKVGQTTLTIETYDGQITVINITVVLDKPKIETTEWLYKNSSKAVIKVQNASKGDIVCLKIGNREYKKKISKNSVTAKIKIRIARPGFYGKKYKLTLLRGKKTVAREVDYVYLSNTVHVGDSKKKVRWITSWNNPDKINYYTYSEQWCYDWEGDDGIHDAYLYFRNGKVSGWQIYG